MMMMEGSDQEEEVVIRKDQLQQIIKGKRTKRPRPMSPLTNLTTTSSSGGADEDGRTSADELSYDQSSTEEEEDMANCLMLLAQGTTTQTTKSVPTTEPATTTTKSKTTAIYVHQCKTCNRCFPSFQALGGHRASHKIKPNVINNNHDKGLMFVKENNNMNTTLSLQITKKAAVVNSFNRGSKSNKVHECSICGAEFSSGQALGGHMRRHRTLTNSPTTTTTQVLPATTLSIGPESDDGHRFNKKPRTVLQLDLNLPAPDEDEHDHHSRRVPEFQFLSSSNEKLLVFSASSLVDCHY